MIKNPTYKVDPENNIFTIREKEFQEIEEHAREIIKPVEKLGFELKEFGLKDVRHSANELFYTVKQNLVILFQKGNSQINLTMSIPKLIDGNYIYINGRRKIPQFQLFDIPIVTRGKAIKMRTNAATLMLTENKIEPFISLSFLGKKVPLGSIMFAYYGADALDKRFNLSAGVDEKDDSIYGKFLRDLKIYHETSEDFTQDDFIKEIGAIFSKYNIKTKGEDLLYALDLIMEVDIFSRKFFRTESVLDELIDAMKNRDEYDDIEFKNKRIRCVEYLILAPLIKSVFDLCMSNRTARQPKFSINSSHILTSCNVSDIVQFDFSINPIDELTKLSRTTLVGNGGFRRESIPEHLKDITPSMFGRVCPVDTPDRDNCGVLQNLIPNTKLDEDKRFSDEILEKQPISAPVSMVPFLNHDDQTRLQMSSSQMRQSIMLREFDKPLIKSGCEGLYSDYTQFLKRAKKDGEVIFFNDRYLIVKYCDDTIEVINVAYRKIYVENMDLMSTYVKEGGKFKAGDILAESQFMQDGEIVFGRNLLTAVMVYYGYNYEDGIIISDRLQKEGLLTSVHYKDLSFTIPSNKVLLSLSEEEFKPLPNIMEWVDPNEPYAIMQDIPSGPIDYSDILKQRIKLAFNKRILITDVNVYANTWYNKIKEYNSWVSEKIKKQKDEEKEFRRVLLSYMPKDKVKKFLREHHLNKFSAAEPQKMKYKMKGEKINGIHVEMYGIYFRTIEEGDKIGNRHGNKGVIARVTPHEEMPQLEDGRHVDICINPLGIISRMNIGQLFELHLGMAVNDFKTQMLERLKDKTKQEELKQIILKFIKLCDNTDGKWFSTQFEEQMPNIITQEFIEQLTVIEPPFESITKEQLDEVMKMTNTKYTQKLYEPYSKTRLRNAVAVGYMYFFRMVHIAESRLAARGIGSYARRTLQPLAGRKNRGGQRCGEMETACFIAHDGPNNLFEMLTTKSDCTDLKNRYIKQMVDTDLVRQEEGEESIVAESVKLLDAYLKVIGITKD